MTAILGDVPLPQYLPLKAVARSQKKQKPGRCLSVFRLLLQVPETEWLLNNGTFSQFWRLDAQDQGVSMLTFW